MNTIREKAQRIAEFLSEMRVDTQGGYHDQWQTREVEGVICMVVASLGYKGEPDLTIMPIEEYVDANDWVLEAISEEQVSARGLSNVSEQSGAVTPPAASDANTRADGGADITMKHEGIRA